MKDQIKLEIPVIGERVEPIKSDDFRDLARLVIGGSDIPSDKVENLLMSEDGMMGIVSKICPYVGPGELRGLVTTTASLSPLSTILYFTVVTAIVGICGNSFLATDIMCVPKKS